MTWGPVTVWWQLRKNSKWEPPGWPSALPDPLGTELTVLNQKLWSYCTALDSWNAGGTRTCHNRTEEAAQWLRFSANPDSWSELLFPVLLGPGWQRVTGGTGDPTPHRGPSHYGRWWSVLSSLFLEVKTTPTFTSYFFSLGLGFCGGTLKWFPNLRHVSLWRENTEDLVTRRWGQVKKWEESKALTPPLPLAPGRTGREEGSACVGRWLLPLWALRSHCLWGLENWGGGYLHSVINITMHELTRWTPQYLFMVDLGIFYSVKCFLFPKFSTMNI